LHFATSGCAHRASDRSIDAGPASPDAARQPITLVDAVDLIADTVATCSISSGVTPMLGGADDLATYPSSQQVPLGAMIGSDAAAIAWDSSRFYVTVRSSAFANAYEPLHIYVEVGDALSEPSPAQGKEYSGLIAAIPFTPTYLIAVRRVSDSGSDGPYDGVYVPANGWVTPVTPLSAVTDVFASADDQTLSVQVAWNALGGCPSALRLAVHVVNGAAGNEWKDLVPTTHTPWQMPGGGYYQLDLTGSPAIANWTLNP